MIDKIDKMIDKMDKIIGKVDKIMGKIGMATRDASCLDKIR